MSAPRLYTKRDLLAAQREAVNQAVEWVFSMARANGGIEHVDARNLATDLFPTPTVIRARVVRDPIADEVEWTVQEGALRQRLHRAGRVPGDWLPYMDYREKFGATAPLQSRVEVWADLFANPLETVEDDGTDSAGSPVSEAGR